MTSPDRAQRVAEIVEAALSVRQAERRSQNGRRSKRKPVFDPNVQELEASLSKTLGLKVQIAHKVKGGGELRIGYRSLEQLDDLIGKLRS